MLRLFFGGSAGGAPGFLRAWAGTNRRVHKNDPSPRQAVLTVHLIPLMMMIMMDEIKL